MERMSGDGRQREKVMCIFENPDIVILDGMQICVRSNEALRGKKLGSDWDQGRGRE